MGSTSQDRILQAVVDFNVLVQKKCIEGMTRMDNKVKCFDEDYGDLYVLSVQDIFTGVEGPNGNHVLQGFVPNAYFWTSVGTLFRTTPCMKQWQRHC